MNEFLLVFRRDYKTKEIQPSPEELQAHLGRWREWFGSLSAAGKLARPPQPWEGKGCVVKNDKSVTDGPYAEIKESIGGFVIIKAENYEAAVETAKSCPIFELGGCVEVRMAAG